MIDPNTRIPVSPEISYAQVLLFRNGGEAIQCQSGVVPFERKKRLRDLGNNTFFDSNISAETSTSYREDSELFTAALSQKLERLFAEAKETEFLDGVESAFSKGLTALIIKNGEIAVKLLSGIVSSRQTNAEVASEALRWIGHLHHPKTFQYRLWLLCHTLLNSSSLRIRDGALLGLSFLDTTQALHTLETAASREHLLELQADIIELIGHLKQRVNIGKAS